MLRHGLPTERPAHARPREMLTVREVAGVFGVHPSTVRSWAKRPGLRPRHWLTVAEALRLEQSRG